MNKTLALEFGTNLFGNLSQEIKERLQAVIDNPCHKTWEDSYSIILNGNGKMTTLWQAVCKVDWMFQQRKGCDEDWVRIPPKETIIEAIKKAVFKEAEQELN